MKKVIGIAMAVVVLFAPVAQAQESRLLTLDEAVAKALANNPSILAGRESIAAADARIDQATLGLLPQLIFNLSYRRATMKSPAPPYLDASMLGDLGSFLVRTDSSSYNNFGAGITLNHTIWDFGRTTGSVAAARENTEAAKSDLVTTREQIRLNTVVAYYLVLATQQTVGVAEEAVRQMEHHLKLAKAQSAAGTRQKIDVTRAESDAAQAKLNLAKAHNGVRTATINLATVMGMDSSAQFRIERPAAGQGPAETSLGALFDKGLKSRPEMKGLESRIRAAEHLDGVATSGYFPNLNLNAGLSWQGYELEREGLPDASKVLPMNWFAGASLSWNALSPIGVSAASKEIEANQRALNAQRRTLELGIRAEIESAALTLDEAKERLEPTQALALTAAETLRLAEGRYAAGAGSIVEVTDAQAIYTQAQLGKIQSEFDVETARARLLRAIGSYSEEKGE